MTIAERLNALRLVMAQNKIDVYYVPTNDFHGSEYVADYFKCREYLSGFTGSAGTLVVSQDEVGLWTDGRYFIQAEKQLAGTGITLYRMNEEGVPDVSVYLKNKLHSGMCLGFDGRVVAADYARKLTMLAKSQGATVESGMDLVDAVWPDRPELEVEPAVDLGLKYAGISREEKLESLRAWMKEKRADALVLTSLDDIAWLLNIRGGDIHCSPVVLSYLVITSLECFLFARKEAFGTRLKQELARAGVIVRDYDAVYDYVKGLAETLAVQKRVDLQGSAGNDSANHKASDVQPGAPARQLSRALVREMGQSGEENEKSQELQAVLAQHTSLQEDTEFEPGNMSNAVAPCRIAMDLRVVNYQMLQSVPEGTKIIDTINPTTLMKAKKNSVEINNERIAHLKDGVALVRFIYWLKQNLEKMPLTEMRVAEQLERFREGVGDYMGPSFDTISGFGEHGAIVHYSATPETDAALHAGEFLLLDSGGHYLEGTTDVTRTILLGHEPTQEQKTYYTAVLRGNLNLGAAKFKQGCSGVALDCLARSPLWELGCDYNHGTGHGVGYLLNVHEGPNAIRYRIVKQPGGNAALEPGMITSNEPGVYLEGKYGIRLENLILCVEREKTAFGQFLGFETLTMVPFEREAIDSSQMTRREIELLNRYHEWVYDNVSPYLTRNEADWLLDACAPID